MAGAYLLCAARLAGLRYWDPWWTGVQVQRRIEALWEGKEMRMRSEPVPLGKISAQLQRAVIAAEDGRFYEHYGIDWVELRDSWEARWDSPRGASTITQQLVKNLFFTTGRSYVRKALELVLAPTAELFLPKKRILELYLNVVEWDRGVFGAQAAARHHYKVPAASLTRNQAARLAACLPAPLRRKPRNMNRYAAIIERRMAMMGW